MTKARIIFYSIFGTYQLLAFVMSLVLENSGLSFQLKVAAQMSVFKWITLIGLILILVDFVWLWNDLRRQKKLDEAYRHENNVLKAKVYDLQEGAKPKPEVPKPN